MRKEAKLYKIFENIKTFKPDRMANSDLSLSIDNHSLDHFKHYITFFNPFCLCILLSITIGFSTVSMIDGDSKI